MNKKNYQKNILIVGFGARVKNTILPAAQLLDDTFHLAGILSKKIHRYSFKGKKFSTLNTTKKIDFSSIDILIIAITTENVPDFLLSLYLQTKNLSHITLFVDTPVLNIHHLWALKYFSLFKNVYVTEDYIALKELEKLKVFIASSRFGKVQHIYLFQSGYRYHALAMIKFLTSSKKVAKIITENNSLQSTHRFIKVNKQISASIIEPKDYSVGKILVTLEDGFITNYKTDNKNTLNCLYNYKDSPSYKQLNKMNITFDDKSKTNWMKIEGVKNILTATYSQKYKYKYLDGVYDHLVISLSEKKRKFNDFFLSSFLKIFVSILDTIPMSLIVKYHQYQNKKGPV